MGIKENKTFQSILIKSLGILGSIIGIGGFAVSFTPIYGVNSIYIGLIGLVVSGIALYLGFRYNNSTTRGLIIIGIITSVLGFSFGYYQKRKIDKLTNAIKEPVEKIKKELSKAAEGVTEEIKDLKEKGTKGIESLKEQSKKQLLEIQEKATKQLEEAKRKGEQELKKIKEDGTSAIKDRLKSFLSDDEKEEDSTDN